MATASSTQAIAHIPGGVPTVSSDLAPTVVFLILFLAGAITSATLLRWNLRQGRKFHFLFLNTVFCVVRILTTSLRIALVYHHDIKGLATAASVFVAAGVLILFVINLFLTQRIFRAAQPHIGWTLPARTLFRICIGLIPPMLIMLIVSVVQSTLTTDKHIQSIDLKLRYSGLAYLLFLAFLPIPTILLALLLPRKGPRDDFGQGKWMIKVCLILTTSAILTLTQGFKASTAFMPSSASASGPWWTDKWTFYFFGFTLEVIVVYLNLTFRIDRLFYIPHNSHNPGDYTEKRAEDLDRQRLVIQSHKKGIDQVESLTDSVSYTTRKELE